MKRVHAFCFAVAAVCTGCESAIDCLDNDGPEFEVTTVSNPVLNQVYSETITVGIRNEPRDDNFFYEFELGGNLPAGVTGSSIGRNYLLNGTATEEGTFRFTVLVQISDNLPSSESGLCFYNASQTFEFTVQPL